MCTLSLNRNTSIYIGLGIKFRFGISLVFLDQCNSIPIIRFIYTIMLK